MEAAVVAPRSVGGSHGAVVMREWGQMVVLG